MKSTADDVLILKEMVSDVETDDLDALDVYRNNVFEIGAEMFKQKMELLSIQKKIDKHVAHCLNPIPRTAPKKSARKNKVHVPDAVNTTKAITIKRKGNEEN
jgi:hypothetical protein